MITRTGLRGLLALIAAGALIAFSAGCGDSDDETTTTADHETTTIEQGGGEASASLIVDNPDNNAVELTIGSKNFPEQLILGEIYAQALEAAGYDVSTDLNLGSEQVALKALEQGEISGYPEYTSTALTSFFDYAPEDVPGDAEDAYEQSKQDFADQGLVAYPPTPFSSANAVGLLTETADELGVKSISDLEGKSQDLTLSGSPECRQRIDCLVGLEQNYGLDFKKFTPVDIGLRYQVLDNGDADLSILFTTDAQLFVNADKYTILEDDQGVLPAGNVMFVASQEAADEAGEDFGATIEAVQENLTLEVMQELNSRVDIDKESAKQVATDYLTEFGYIE